MQIQYEGLYFEINTPTHLQRTLREFVCVPVDSTSNKNANSSPPNKESIKGVPAKGISRAGNTYSSQSTAMISVTSSAGRPTVSNTITMVTSPAWGIPAAPMLAAVAVTLERTHTVTVFGGLDLKRRRESGSGSCDANLSGFCVLDLGLPGCVMGKRVERMEEAK